MLLYRKCFLGVVGLICWQVCRAQEQVTGRLPDSLKQGAAMVKRSDETEIDIESPKKARVRHKYVYTILSYAGERWSEVSTWYDKFHDVANVSATVYDSTGRPVKKMKKSDLEDWNIGGMGMLMMDIRLKRYSFGYRVYPYTIEFEEVTDLDGLFALPPQWVPQSSPEVSVLSCSLVIHLPPDYPLLYHSYHVPEPEITTGKKKTLTWRVTNLPARMLGIFSVAYWRSKARVDLAPGSFILADYKGSAETWQEFGRFVGSLYKGRDQLPDEAKRKVHSLVDSLTDPRQKINALYDYLQQNTHYVGIELGIGGWQPFDAANVYNKRYGDCKALVNFMVALLKEAGVRASPVLIRSGVYADPIDTDIACNQFNHVIAAAFAGPDTVWLECTSQTLPPGYLSGFTANRDGLLLDESGGYIVHTPVYGIHDNWRTSKVRGRVDDNGTLEATSDNRYSGLFQDAPKSLVDRTPRKNLSEMVRRSLNIPNGIIHDPQYRSDRATIPVLEETFGISAERFALFTGSRMMITPGSLGSTFTHHTNVLAPRNDSFEMGMSNETNDTIVLELPRGWVPEGHLPNFTSSGPFGDIRVHAWYSDGVLTLVLHDRWWKGVYPPDEYDRLVRATDLFNREKNRSYYFVRLTAP